MLQCCLPRALKARRVALAALNRPSPGADVGAGEACPGADVGAVRSLVCMVAKVVDRHRNDRHNPSDEGCTRFRCRRHCSRDGAQPGFTERKEAQPGLYRTQGGTGGLYRTQGGTRRRPRAAAAVASASAVSTSGARHSAAAGPAQSSTCSPTVQRSAPHRCRQRPCAVRAHVGR